MTEAAAPQSFMHTVCTLISCSHDAAKGATKLHIEDEEDSVVVEQGTGSQVIQTCFVFTESIAVQRVVLM